MTDGSTRRGRHGKAGANQHGKEPVGLVAKPARLTLLLVCLVFTLVSASPPRGANDWERQGNAAFDDGRFGDAIKCYEHAAAASDQPGRVAFNHGVALFYFGKYRDAEKFFRCVLESKAPVENKERALYNLGTCLMHTDDGKDGDRLAEAIACFSRCLEKTPVTDELAANARTNLELAKLLWRRIRGTDALPPDRDPSSASDERGADQPPKDGPGEEPGPNRGASNSGAGQRQLTPKPGSNSPQPIPTAQAPPPGAGHTQPIPDSEQAKPLPPNEARELLRQAEERIARERRALQRAGMPGEGKNYPDW